MKGLDILNSALENYLLCDTGNVHLLILRVMLSHPNQQLWELSGDFTLIPTFLGRPGQLKHFLYRERGPKSLAWPLLSFQCTGDIQTAKTLPGLRWVRSPDKLQDIKAGLFLWACWKQFASFVSLVKAQAPLCESEEFSSSPVSPWSNLPVLNSSKTFIIVYSSKLSCKRTNCRLIWCIPWHSSNMADWRIRSLQREGNKIQRINTGERNTHSTAREEGKPGWPGNHALIVQRSVRHTAAARFRLGEEAGATETKPELCPPQRAAWTLSRRVGRESPCPWALGDLHIALLNPVPSAMDGRVHLTRWQN